MGFSTRIPVGYMVVTDCYSIKKSHKDYEEADKLCFLSKNLYNATLYTVRQYYFATKKYLNYGKVNKQFTDDNNVDYRALPAKVAKWTQMKEHDSWKSYFESHKDWKKHSEKYKGEPRIPKYLDKIKGRFVVHYPKDALSFVAKKGYIKLSMTNIYIKTDIEKTKVRYVEIVPCGSSIKFVVGYLKKIDDLKRDNKRYASMDIGVNNLATLTSNVMKPYIIDGKIIKSENRYVNKKNAELKSLLDIEKEEGKKAIYREKIAKLWLKRRNIIDDYLSKATVFIVNQLVSNSINTLVIGMNTMWKQDTNMGKVNNQNFCYIPFADFVDKLKYKCKLVGINVEVREESYTSKASFFDNDEIPTYKKNSKKVYKFSGKRIKRGLYRTKSGKIVNADVNGSLNILKKYLEKQVKWDDQIRSELIEQSSDVNILRLRVKVA